MTRELSQGAHSRAHSTQSRRNTSVDSYRSGSGDGSRGSSLHRKSRIGKFRMMESEPHNSGSKRVSQQLKLQRASVDGGKISAQSLPASFNADSFNSGHGSSFNSGHGSFSRQGSFRGSGE